MTKVASMVMHRGSCHCGRVRFEVLAAADIVVSECNCSICSRSGYLGLIVPRSQFRLLQGSDALTTYTFNTGVAQHYFCAYCGIKSFYVPRSRPDGYNVNARCIEPGTVHNITVRAVDGQNWEQTFSGGRGADGPN